MEFSFEREDNQNKFPKISNGFEPRIEPALRTSPIIPLDPFVQPNFLGIPGPGKPDFIPDFSERFDVKNDSVCLALHTVGLTKAEYNSISVEQLKSQRTINCSGAENYAWNILIYYKKNSQISTPYLHSGKLVQADNFFASRIMPGDMKSDNI